MPKISKKPVAADHEEAEWKLNSLVLCRYLHTEVFYEAKIINIAKDANSGGFVYKVHYQGWNSRHDEKINEEDAKIRFKVHTEEAAEQAKETIKNALHQVVPKSKKSATKKTSLEDVERSTPSPSVDPYKKVYRTTAAFVQRHLSTKVSDTAQQDTSSLANSKQPSARRSESREASQSSTPHRSSSQLGTLHATTTATNISTKKTKRRVSRENGKAGDGPAAKKPEIKALTFCSAELSDDMGNILKLDNYLVKEQFFVPNLPATFTIADIMDEYRQSLEKESVSTATTEDVIPSSAASSADELPSFSDRELSANVEFIMGIMDFFDAFLETRFLYVFERERHEEYALSVNESVKTMGASPTLRMSHHYGLPHLLRLLVKLPETMESANIPCTQITVDIMKYRTDRLMSFLNDNWQKYFIGEDDYQPAPLTYISRYQKKVEELLAKKEKKKANAPTSKLAVKSAIAAIAQLSSESVVGGGGGSVDEGDAAENKENEFDEAKISAKT